MERINKLIIYIYFFLVNFCYIKFFNIGMDTDIQLYYFFVGLILILCNCKKILKSKQLLVILAVLLGTIVYSFFVEEFNNSKINFIFFRGIYAYCSFYLSLLCFFIIIYNYGLKFIEKNLKRYYWIWNIVAIFQLINSNYFTFWRNRVGNAGGRGSIAFTNEPFYYALYLILVSLILYVINNKNKIYLLISFLAIIILAKSTQGVLYYVVIIGILEFKKLLKIKSLITIGVLFMISIIYLNSLEEGRMYKLYYLFRYHPIALLTKDGSIGIRITQWLAILEGVIENNGMAYGFNAWKDYYADKLLNYKEFFLWINPRKLVLGKIGSLFGAMIFELGAVYSILFWSYLKKLIKKNKFMLVFLVMSIHGLNLTNPMLSLTIVIMFFITKN